MIASRWKNIEMDNCERCECGMNVINEEIETYRYIYSIAVTLSDVMKCTSNGQSLPHGRVKHSHHLHKPTFRPQVEQMPVWWILMRSMQHRTGYHFRRMAECHLDLRNAWQKNLRLLRQ